MTDMFAASNINDMCVASTCSKCMKDTCVASDMSDMCVPSYINDTCVASYMNYMCVPSDRAQHGQKCKGVRGKQTKRPLSRKKGFFNLGKKVSFPLTKREFQTLRRENAMHSAPS